MLTKQSNVPLKSESTEVQALMSQVEGILAGRKDSITGQYRDKVTKTRFDLKWAFLLGCSINALGASVNKKGVSSFKTPHNIPEKHGKGVCLIPVADKVSTPAWKIDLWAVCCTLIDLIDADFAQGEFAVNFSCMDSQYHHVMKHVDSDDISPQYAMALGTYPTESAFLRVYGKDDEVVGDYEYKNRILLMDGRRAHELITTDAFSGSRYCVIFFKTYDHKEHTHTYCIG